MRFSLCGYAASLRTDLLVLCYNLPVEKIGEILKRSGIEPSKYIHHEFQDFGYRLAVELNDLEHRSLYMKLAKEEPRGRLERALSFAKDAAGLRDKKSKAKLFMWKLKELRDAARESKKVSC